MQESNLTFSSFNENAASPKKGCKNTGSHVLGLLLVVALVVLTPNAVTASTYYVATTGSDANPGIQTYPFRTIAKGLSVTRAGDTLFIRGGNYNESIDSNRQTIPTGTSWHNAPRIAAYPAAPYEVVVLNGSSSGGVFNLAHGYIQYVIFEGFVIDGTGRTGGIGTYGGPHHVRFLNVEVKNSSTNGIFLGRDPSSGWMSLEFINAKVHNNGSHGFYVSSSGNLIDGCEIYSNGGLNNGNNHYGIQLYNSTNPRGVNGNVVRGNHIYGHTFQSFAGALIMGSGDGNVAYNNLIYANRNGIIVTGGYPTNTQIHDNTIHDNSDYGIQVQTGTGAVVKNNTLFLNFINLSFLVSVSTL